MENIGKYDGHLVYFKSVLYISWTFGIFCGHLVYFPPFWYFVPRKIWQPWFGSNLHPHLSPSSSLSITGTLSLLLSNGKWFFVRKC
jgi:hypothetical protein